MVLQKHTSAGHLTLGTLVIAASRLWPEHLESPRCMLGQWRGLKEHAAILTKGGGGIDRRRESVCLEGDCGEWNMSHLRSSAAAAVCLNQLAGVAPFSETLILPIWSHTISLIPHTDENTSKFRAIYTRNGSSMKYRNAQGDPALQHWRLVYTCFYQNQYSKYSYYHWK